MLTLFTTLISFLTGGLPKLLDFFQGRQDNKHELEMARLQIERELELRKAGYEAALQVEEIKLDEVKLQTESQMRMAELSAFATERTSMYNHDIEIGKGASRWVINLRASVRPAITFGLFSLLVFVDCFGFYYAIHTGVDFQTAISLLWDDDTQTIWASIVAFWFGTQAFKR